VAIACGLAGNALAGAASSGGEPPGSPAPRIGAAQDVTAAQAPPRRGDSAGRTNAPTFRAAEVLDAVPSKSYGLYVGNNLTASGDPLIAGSG